MKKLIASGCSFTFEDWNWPTFLAENIGIEKHNLINVGMGSQGNGIIAKKLLYRLDQELKTTKPEDILVGVMWSGIDRHDEYIDLYINNEASSFATYKQVDGWLQNPTSITGGDEKRNWMIMNPHWKNKYCKLYYEVFHSEIGSWVKTLQSMLLVQYYCKEKGVKYFMTSYLDIWKWCRIDDVDIKYLYNAIDFNQFIDIKGCMEWVKEHYYEEGMPHDGAIHPLPFGHEKFAKEVIIPHLIKKNII